MNGRSTWICLQHGSFGFGVAVQKKNLKSYRLGLLDRSLIWLKAFVYFFFQCLLGLSPNCPRRGSRSRLRTHLFTSAKSSGAHLNVGSFFFALPRRSCQGQSPRLPSERRRRMWRPIKGPKPSVLASQRDFLEILKYDFKV